MQLPATHAEVHAKQFNQSAVFMPTNHADPGRGSTDFPQDADIYEMLWIRLNKAMSKIPGEQNIRYLPNTELHKIIDIETSRKIFSLMSNLDHRSLDTHASKVTHDSPRLFAITIYLRLPLTLLLHLMEIDFSDKNLPWIGAPPPGLGERDSEYFTHLINHQWQFTPMVFSKIGLHEKLNADTIIPFLKRQPCGYGVFSTVSRIRLESSHQNLYSTPQDPNPELALKVIHQYMDSTTTFQNETALLHGLGELQNPHIVKLLYTYEQNDMYHLIFPAAECNLDEHMAQDPQGFEDPKSTLFCEFTSWILHQLSGIAAAVNHMHEWTCSTTVPGSTAYHHDLKPSNLLLFKELDFEVPRFGILQIADFGSGRLRGPGTGTGSTTFRGTPTYAAPESIVPRMSHNNGLEIYVSRSYDVWSLGCIAMEVLVWLVFGAQGRKDFNKERFGPVSMTQENDGYFVLGLDGNATVRVQVIEWFDKLREHPRLPQENALCGLLVLIINTLEVNSDKRITAREFSQRLDSLVEHADNRLGYGSA
ncbi:protein kinase domain-containing protein [Phlyctema vagabunda]|uniref:Protein kinase domain-containing protein n=1 Tax=Phlyctema vagabunda TaxID=108571 RepID=A0ABR4PHA5_9HELO